MGFYYSIISYDCDNSMNPIGNFEQSETSKIMTLGKTNVAEMCGFSPI